MNIPGAWMSNRRRFIQSTSALLAGLASKKAGLPQSLQPGNVTQEQWFDRVGGSDYSMVLEAMRDIASPDVEGDTARCMLADFFLYRAHNAGSSGTAHFYTSELHRIKQLQKIPLATLQRVMRDPNFLQKLQQGITPELTVSPQRVVGIWADVQRLHALPPEELEAVFKGRGAQAVTSNFARMVESIIHISTAVGNGMSRGYSITCLVPDVEKARNAVSDILGQNLPAGSYTTLSYNGVTQTGISGGPITQIQLVSEKRDGSDSTELLTYVIRKCHYFGKEHPEIQYDIRYR